jgi:hypothetical protein
MCVYVCERGGAFLRATQQEQPAHGNQAGMLRVGVIATGFEHRLRSRQCAPAPAQIAHRQRHLGFRDDAACTRHILAITHKARGPAQQLACARVFAELRHRDTAQSEGWRVIAQGDTLQGVERVTSS